MAELWVGIHKITEETAELNQVVGKLNQVPEGRHWDEYTRSDGSAGEKPLRVRLVEEMADVYAALDFMRNRNLTYGEEYEIKLRRRDKFDLYCQWAAKGELRGIKP